MTAALFVDVEGPIRAWTRGLNLDGVGSRVFLGLPERCTFPAIDLFLVDGGVGNSDTPMPSPLIQFNVWGGTRAGAAAIAWALTEQLDGMLGGTTLDASLVGMGAVVTTGPIFRPDPDGKPRYILDAALTVRVP
jgi:hypothetical protein